MPDGITFTDNFKHHNCNYNKQTTLMCITWLRASMIMIVGCELGLLSTPQVNCAAVSILDGNDDS